MIHLKEMHLPQSILRTSQGYLFDNTVNDKSERLTKCQMQYVNCIAANVKMFHDIRCYLLAACKQTISNNNDYEMYYFSAGQWM